MLTATPGDGPVPTVTIATVNSGDDPYAARVVPHPSRDDGSVDLVDSVDVVLPHGDVEPGKTGLVLQLLDEEAARALGRAAYRAAVMLGQKVRPFACPVDDLPEAVFSGTAPVGDAEPALT